MSRSIKISIGVVAALCLVSISAWLFVRHSFSDGGEQSSREIPVSEGYVQELRAAGFPISVQRVFEASSFSGWHGDGSAVTAYRYPPAESDALIEALKLKQPGFTWTETPSGAVTIGSMRDKLPKEFLPSSDSATLLVGRPPNGLPMFEFIVDRSRGTLYSVSNRF